MTDAQEREAKEDLKHPPHNLHVLLRHRLSRIRLRRGGRQSRSGRSEDRVSRSAFLRELLRRAAPLDEAPSYPESLLLLARSARAGKVQAQVALERALRDENEGEPEGELARLLRDE